MPDSAVDLLFRMKAEASGVKPGGDEAKAVISQVRAHFGSELGAMQTAGKSALQTIGDDINVFARERIPFAGRALGSISVDLDHLRRQASAAAPDLGGLNKQIEAIAAQSFGKSKAQVSEFLTEFSKIDSAALRNTKALEFFGNFTGTKLAPQLEAARTQIIGIASAEVTSGMLSVALAAGGVAIALGAIAATAFEAVKHTAEFRDSLYNLSLQTGLSVETLSAFEFQAASVGSSVGELAVSFGLFQRQLQQAQDPASKAAEVFRDLGLTVGTNTEKELRKTLKALSELGPGSRQTTDALEIFGRSYRPILAILKESGGDIDGVIEKLRSMNLLVTTEAASAAHEFTENLNLMSFELRGLVALFSDQVSPALDDFATKGKGAGEVLRGFALVLGSIVGNILRGVKEVLEFGAFVGHAAALIIEPLLVGLEEIGMVLSDIGSAIINMARGDFKSAWRDLIGTDAYKKEWDQLLEDLKEHGRRVLEYLGFVKAEAENKAPGVVEPQQRLLIEDRQPQASVSPFLKSKEELDAANRAVAEEKRLAEQKAEIDRNAVQVGAETKTQEIESTIAAALKMTDAQVAQMRAERNVKQERLNGLHKESDDRQKELDKQLAALDSQGKKETDEYEKLRKQRESAGSRDTEQARQLGEDIQKIDEKIADTQNAFMVNAARQRRDARKSDADKQREDEAAHTDALVKVLDFRHEEIDKHLRAELILQKDALPQLDAIENARNEIQREGLQKQISFGQLSLAELDRFQRQLAALDQERTNLEQSQADRRIEYATKEANEKLSRRQEARKAEEEVTRIEGETKIAAQQALAVSGIQSEEATAKKIGEIRETAIKRQRQQIETAANDQKDIIQAELNAMDQELTRINVRLEAARSLPAGAESTAQAVVLSQQYEALIQKRLDAQAVANKKEKEIDEKRNNDLKVVGAQLTKQEIEDQAAQDQARQDDIHNRERYAKAIIQIKRGTQNEERNIAQADLDLLELSKAPQSTILAAQKTSALADLEARRKQAQDAIDLEEASTLDRLHLDQHLLEEKLKVEKDPALIQAIDKQLNTIYQLENLYDTRRLLTEEEFQKRRLAILKRFAQEEKALSPTGAFLSGMETGRLTELKDGIQSFADVAKVAFSSVGVVVNGLAQGVGNMIQQWVLMGDLGPNAVRKMVASVLAGLAAQAAVESLMELARGFAALADPLTAWEAPLHFKAAAIFGAVAAVSAVAGRAIAGNAFQTGAAGGGGVGGGGSSSSGSGGSGGGSSSGSSSQPIVLGSQRQMVEHKVTVIIKAQPGFVADAVVDALRNNHADLTTHVQKTASRGND